MKPTTSTPKPRMQTRSSSKRSPQTDTSVLLPSESESSEAGSEASEVSVRPADAAKKQSKGGPGKRSSVNVQKKPSLMKTWFTYCFCAVVGAIMTLAILMVLKVVSYADLKSSYGKVWTSGPATSQEPMDFEVYAPAPETPSQCADTCTFTIVESIPQNLTYNDTDAVHPSTYTALKTLMASAKRSIHIASYYWTLLGTDIAYHDQTAAEGEDIFRTLLDIGKANQVQVQIAQNAENNDTATLAREGHAEVRTVNFTRLLGSGILHTKFWLVDGQHFYIGSANLDWRSLTQVKELGVLVQNCPCLGADLQKIFDVYWYLGNPDANIPSQWPAQFDTSINATNPMDVPFNNTHAPVFISSSPPQFCPEGRTTDIAAILYVIRQAKSFISIAVMDYAPATLYDAHDVYWPVIDDALREAAFDRNVTVRLLTSKWTHTMKDMYVFLCSLKMMDYLHRPHTRIELKLFEVPADRDQSKIPYARVNHNKYMVTDQHAYIGTSNWSGDYFISTGGVGFIVNQPYSNTTTEGDFREDLYQVFKRDWESGYTEYVSCPPVPHNHTESHVDQA